MGKILDLYRTQIDVLWNWSGGRVALVKRLLITLVVATIAFAATAALLRSVTVDSVAAAFAAVVLMALFNAVIRVGGAGPHRPVLAGRDRDPRARVPGARVPARASVVPGVHLSGVLSALVASLVYAAINTVLTAILGIDQSDSYYGRLMQAMLVRTSAPEDGPAGPRHHPDRRPRPPDPRRADPRRLGQHDGRLGARQAATSSRAGRRSCRR